MAKVTFTYMDHMAHGLHAIQRMPVEALRWRELKPAERRRLRANVQALHKAWQKSQRKPPVLLPRFPKRWLVGPGRRPRR